MKITSILILLSFIFTSLQADAKQTMSITDNFGKEYNLTTTEQGFKFHGIGDKIVFLELFGHQCPPCIGSIAHLTKIQKKYSNDLAIVAIEVQGQNKEDLLQFRNKHGINYITVRENDAKQLVDYITVRAEWQGSIPFLLVVDKKGEVQMVKLGATSETQLEEIVNELR